MPKRKSNAAIIDEMTKGLKRDLERLRTGKGDKYDIALRIVVRRRELLLAEAMNRHAISLSRTLFPGKPYK